LKFATIGKKTTYDTHTSLANEIQSVQKTLANNFIPGVIDTREKHIDPQEFFEFSKNTHTEANKFIEDVL
jgi:hypothetical protein